MIHTIAALPRGDEGYSRSQRMHCGCLGITLGVTQVLRAYAFMILGMRQLVVSLRGA